MSTCSNVSILWAPSTFWIDNDIMKHAISCMQNTVGSTDSIRRRWQTIDRYHFLSSALTFWELIWTYNVTFLSWKKVRRRRTSVYPRALVSGFGHLLAFVVQRFSGFRLIGHWKSLARRAGYPNFQKLDPVLMNLVISSILPWLANIWKFISCSLVKSGLWTFAFWSNCIPLLCLSLTPKL